MDSLAHDAAALDPSADHYFAQRGVPASQAATDALMARLGGRLNIIKRSVRGSSFDGQRYRATVSSLDAALCAAALLAGHLDDIRTDRAAPGWAVSGRPVAPSLAA